MDPLPASSHVPFVVFDPIALQELSKLLLEGHGTVV